MNYQKYIQLLIEIKPEPIKDKEQHKKVLSQIDKLMYIPETQMTEEQARILELLAILVEDYESNLIP